MTTNRQHSVSFTTITISRDLGRFELIAILSQKSGGIVHGKPSFDGHYETCASYQCLLRLAPRVRISFLFIIAIDNHCLTIAAVREGSWLLTLRDRRRMALYQPLALHFDIPRLLSQEYLLQTTHFWTVGLLIS